MDEEMVSLQENSTWTLEQQPPGVKPILIKWVFKVKRDALGNIERYKARLVAKGFMRQEGIDYNEVFAPVSKHASLRALLAIAAAEDMELHQLDITTAFLNGHLEETIYMQQPEGYAEGGKAQHGVSSQQFPVWLEASTPSMEHAPQARAGGHGLHSISSRP